MRLKKISIENSSSHLFVYLLLQTLLWSLCITNIKCELKVDIRNEDLLDLKKCRNCSQNIIDSFSIQSPQQYRPAKSARNLSLAIRKKAHINNKHNVQKSIYFFYYKYVK